MWNFWQAPSTSFALLSVRRRSKAKAERARLSFIIRVVNFMTGWIPDPPPLFRLALLLCLFYHLISAFRLDFFFLLLQFDLLRCYHIFLFNSFRLFPTGIASNFYTRPTAIHQFSIQITDRRRRIWIGNVCVLTSCRFSLSLFCSGAKRPKCSRT